MRYDIDWLKESLKRGESHDFLGFWGDDSDTSIEKTFSNFHKTPIRLDDHDFECSEQAFMWQKATFFHDDETAERILASGLEPIDYKHLGRAVRGYDDDAWNGVRYQAMLRADLAKFSQSPELSENLESTGDSVLVETSPFDRVWGVRLGKRTRDGGVDERWRNPEKWRGTNLMGFVLMEVRDVIREG